MSLRHAPPYLLALSRRMRSQDESPYDGGYPPIQGAIVGVFGLSEVVPKRRRATVGRMKDGSGFYEAVFF